LKLTIFSQKTIKSKPSHTRISFIWYC